MLYNLVEDIEKEIGRTLSHGEKKLIELLIRSKIGDIDGLKLDKTETTKNIEFNNKEDCDFVVLVRKGDLTNGKEFVLKIDKVGQRIVLCDMYSCSETTRDGLGLGIIVDLDKKKFNSTYVNLLYDHRYEEKGHPYRICQFRFSDDNNVIEVESNIDSYNKFKVSLYRGAVNTKDGDGLIPDETFDIEIVEDADGRKLNCAGMFKVPFPKLIGGENLLHTAWAAATLVSKLYEKTYQTQVDVSEINIADMAKPNTSKNKH